MYIRRFDLICLLVCVLASGTCKQGPKVEGTLTEFHRSVIESLMTGNRPALLDLTHKGPLHFGTDFVTENINLTDARATQEFLAGKGLFYSFLFDTERANVLLPDPTLPYISFAEAARRANRISAGDQLFALWVEPPSGSSYKNLMYLRCAQDRCVIWGFEAHSTPATSR